MLNRLRNILCVGMPVADILISGDNTSIIMTRYDMQPAMRNMLSDAQIATLEAEINAANSQNIDPQTLNPQALNVEIVAGGSMANTACSVAGLCRQNIKFFAAIADDNYGAIFAEGLSQAGVQHLKSPKIGTETSRSYVISDATGERAIARHLGDSMSALKLEHLRPHIDDCDLMLLEGELPSLPNGAELWLELLEYAKQQNKMIGFSLFGAEQITKHRELFMQTITEYADIMFGNEGELAALFDAPTTYFTKECADIYAIMQARNPNAIMCISNGEHAPYLASKNGVFHVAPSNVDGLVNTLGAGDGFMAGTLSGLLNGLDENAALMLGHKVAAKILQQAAPQLSKAQLLAL